MPTQDEIAKHLDLSVRRVRELLPEIGINHRTASMDDIRIAYIRHQRELAAGRGGGDAQAEAAQARMEKDRAQTAMLRLGYHKELKTLIVADDAEAALIDWAGYASREYSTGVDKLVLELESTHGIEIDRDQVKDIVSPTVERIQSYAAKLGAGLVSGCGSVHATEAGGNSAVD